MNFRKIEIEEFDKLKTLFPSNAELWEKYKEKRLTQLYKDEIDVFIVEENSKFIGEITCNYKNQYLQTETIPNKRAYFEAFRINKNYQGKGLGQALINYCIEYLFNIGYTEFTIGVEEDNEIAKHIYFKLGFTESIDKGYGDEFDPTYYTLYLKTIEINEIIQKLIKRCGLGNINEEPIRVSGGLLNRMYKIKTDKGTYAIKLLNPEVMKRPTAMTRHMFAEKVANIAKDNGIKCLPSKTINNKNIQEVNGYYFLVFDWVEAKSINEEELTIEKCKKVAVELAKLHKVNFDNIKDETQSHYSKEEIDWEFYIQRLNNKRLKELLIENKDKLNELDKKAIKALKIIENNTVISHSDLDLTNVLWDNDEPILIDWESVGAINPSMELVDTAWNWSGGQNFFDIQKFKVFVTTYDENGGDTSEFNLAIDANFKAKFGWLEYNLKRVCGIECLDEEEQILGEKEVERSIDEINKFEFYSQFMKK